MRFPIPAVFRHRNAALLWIGQFSSFVGDQLHEIALIWIVWEVTRSSTATALVTMASRVPFWLLGLIGGALADFWPRRLTVILGAAFNGLFVVTIPILYMAGVFQIYHLAIVAFAVSTTRCVYAPALVAEIPSLVPRDQLQAINGVLDNTKRVARTVGPTLAVLGRNVLPIIHFFTIDVSEVARP